MHKDDDGEDLQHREWLWASLLCTGVLAAGAIASFLTALRHGGCRQCAGIEVPRCEWLTSRRTVQVASWCALTSGLAEFLLASKDILCSWDGDVPPFLLGYVTVTYVLLLVAGFMWLAGLRWRSWPQVDEALSLAAKVAGLVGLAVGLTADIVCELFQSEHDVETGFRRGCSTLSASSGFLLLGLYLQELRKGRAARPPPQMHSRTTSEVDTLGDGMSVEARITRWPSLGREWHTIGREFPEPREPFPTGLHAPLLTAMPPATGLRAGGPELGHDSCVVGTASLGPGEDSECSTKAEEPPEAAFPPEPPDDAERGEPAEALRSALLH